MKSLALLLAFAAPALGQSLTISTYAGGATVPGTADGTGTDARFRFPQGVATDSAGNVYVADTNNHTIRRINTSGLVTTFAGAPGIPGSTNGAYAFAQFNSPAGVAVDKANGTIYVADTGNNVIRKLAGGAVTTFAGVPGTEGQADGNGAAARFKGPTGLAVDGSGNVYVTDRQNHTVRRITPAGDVTTPAGAGGTIGSADGTGNAARFRFPYGIAHDVTSGNLYVADAGNSLVRRMTPSGTVTTLAGAAQQTGTADGTGAAARFNNCSGVATDNVGLVYVADTSNQTVRRVTPAGAVTTVAGLALTPGAADGTGNAARFNYHVGLAVSGSSLFVADQSNHTVRQSVLPAGGTCTSTAANLCLNTGRFSVSVSWRNYNDGQTGTGQAVSLTSDSGYFWFFNAANIELVIKVLDGRSVNGYFWVLFGALSDVEYTVTVVDTATGAQKSYYNPPRTLASVADVVALAGRPDLEPPHVTGEEIGKLAALTSVVGEDERTPGAGADVHEALADPPLLPVCATSGGTLCIQQSRFQTQVAFINYNNGQMGNGQAVQLTSDSGYFWFFNAANVELMLKILDGRSVNGKFWVLFGALSDVEYTITITDTQTFAQKSYYNPPRHLASVADVNALSGP